MLLKAYVQEGAADIPIEALYYQLSAGGTRAGSLLYESQDEHGKFTGFSIAVLASCLSISGRQDAFSIEALTQQGCDLLKIIKDRLPACVTECKVSDNSISGVLKPDLAQVELQQRLLAVNHMSLLRALRFELETTYPDLPLGLFGGFAYSMVRQYEHVPLAKQDLLHEEDYRFYLGTRVCIVDHARAKTYFISLQSAQDLKELVQAANDIKPLAFGAVSVGGFQSDTSVEDYLKNVERLKEHIFQGDIFQVQYGRSVSADFSGDAFKVYSVLKKLNPSPFMFYRVDPAGVLLAASPELALSVEHHAQGRCVTITPIAGTKARGFINGVPDRELDQRYAISLQTDKKELAEHVMLIDLARNDIATIAKPCTTHVDESLIVKKYAHVQHLVSRVSGLLRDDIDELTAYLATMNMGTLTGAPKPMAMKLIAEFEKTERGYYGGGFGFITYRGELEMAIIIRAIRIKNGVAYLRACAGIVADSVPMSEYMETENKMRSTQAALLESAS